MVFINNSVETFTPTQSGAIATHIWECCRAAQADGAAPTVVSIRCEAQTYENMEVVLLDYPKAPDSLLGKKLLRALRRFHGWQHLRQPTYARRLARTIERRGLARRPLILHNDPELALFLRRRFPTARIIHHFHNQHACTARFRLQIAAANLQITAVSDFTARWVETFYGLKPGSVTTVYNGVDSTHFRPAASRPEGIPAISFVGRTGIEKAPDLLLKAAGHLADRGRAFKLQILGSNHWQKFEMDDYQKELCSLVEGLERRGITVHKPGHVGRERLPDELRNAQIHVMPSRWDEPFGLATLEGMATGLATVASNTGGTPEVLGRDGMLFERDSAESLARCLEILLDDITLRDEYARKARERAQRFTWANTWGRFQKVAGLS